MRELLKRSGGLMLAAGVFLSGVTLAEAPPSVAMAEPTVLTGSVKVQVGQPPSQLPRLDWGNGGRQLVIDEQARRIGGAEDRASGPDPQLPAQKFPFFIDPQSVQGAATLNIGYIRGINTPEAHAAGQSEAAFISSPAVVKVNGVRLHYIYTDGDRVQVQIPRSVLRADGFNVVQIEAGFYFLPDNRVAYDELRLQSLALSY